MPTPNIARQIADMDQWIAEIDTRILQKQKRLENLLAKGADVTELRKAIAMLIEGLAYLEAHKADLEHRQQGNAGA